MSTHSVSGACLSALLLLAAASTTASAQTANAPAKSPEAAQTKPAGPGGKLNFTQDTVDAGEVVKGESAKFVYEFTNTGEGELLISDIKTSCGCTAANKAELVGKVFKPGDKGQVVANVSTKNLRGPFTKTITVFSNDATDDKYKLQAKAVVKTLVDVTPSNRVFFRLTKGDDRPTKKIVTLKSDKDNKFKVNSVKSSSDVITAKLVKSDQPKDESIYQIEVDVSNDVPVGSLSGTVTIATSHPKVKEIELRVNGQILGQVVVSPSRVYLGRITKDKLSEIERKVRIEKRDGKDFKIKKVSSSNTGIKVEVKQVEAGKSYELIMTMDADKLTMGQLNTTLTVETNDKDQNQLSVPVIGTLVDK